MLLTNNIKLMKTLLKNVLGGVVLLTAAFATVSCNKGEEQEPAPKAVVSVEVDEPTSTTVSFTINYENAKTLAYACIEEANVENVELTEVELEEAKGSMPVSLDNLTAETAYVVVAEATNADGVKSDRVTEKFTTAAAPAPDAPTVVIGNITADITAATVAVTISNADAFYYAVVAKGEEPTEYKNDVEATATQVVLSELTAATDYTFYAYAAQGETEGEVVSKDFTTLAEEGIVLDGEGDIEVTFSSATANALEFDVQLVDLGTTTKRAYYIFSEAGKYTEETATEELVNGENASMITSSGLVVVGGDLTPETSYDVWFIACDMNNKYSDLVKMTESTIAEEPAGEPVAELGEVTDKSIEINFLVESNYGMKVMVFPKGTFADEDAALEEFANGWKYVRLVEDPSPYVANALAPATTYEVWVAEMTGAEAYGPITKLETTTAEEAVGAAVAEVGEVTSNSITLNYLSTDNKGMKIMVFTEGTFTDDAAAVKEFATGWKYAWTDDSGATSIVITEWGMNKMKPIEAETTYQIWVAELVDAENYGPITKLEVTTLASGGGDVEMPTIEPGEIAAVAETGATSVTIYYNYPDIMGGLVLFEAITTEEYNQSTEEAIVDALVNDFNAAYSYDEEGMYTFTGLTPNTEYKLVVVGDAGGDYTADIATILTVTTAAE